MKHPEISTVALAGVTLTFLGRTPAQPPPVGDAGASVRANFDNEQPGAPPGDFECMVGDWNVAEDGGQRGLRVDGSRWRQGTPSVSIADQARRLYGERYAEFLDGVRAFAFFLLAVLRGRTWSGNYRVSVRFYPENGRVDQAAGIAFALAPDGSYLGVGANALEENLLFFRVARGHRTIIDNVRGVSTASRSWHTLTLTVRGRRIETEVDGSVRHTRELDVAPAGRVGLWSKADSQVLFDDFEVRSVPLVGTPAAGDRGGFSAQST